MSTPVRGPAPLDLTLLAAVVHQAGYGKPEWEFRFHPKRLWRFDLAWPALMVAFEREGFGPRGAPGRHQLPAGYRGDCHKYNAAVLLGWAVVRGTGKMIADGTAADALLAVLDAKRKGGAS